MEPTMEEVESASGRSAVVDRKATALDDYSQREAAERSALKAMGQAFEEIFSDANLSKLARSAVCV